MLTLLLSFQDEDREEGLVRQHIWVGYGKALTKKLLGCIISCYLLASGLQTGSSFWLSYWSNQSDHHDDKGSSYYISIYAGLSLGTMFLIWLRATTIALATVAAGMLVLVAVASKSRPASWCIIINVLI